MRRAVVALFVSLLGANAHADARHEDVELKPWKEQGEVVGFKLKLTLRPAYYSFCQVGLGCMDEKKAGADYTEKRRAAWDKDKGYLRLVFPLETGLSGDKDVEYPVRYGDGNDLKPGETVDVISGFSQNEPKDRVYVHIWGMAFGPVTKSDEKYVLPGAKAAPAPAAVEAQAAPPPVQARRAPKLVPLRKGPAHKPWRSPEIRQIPKRLPPRFVVPARPRLRLR